MLNPSVDGHEPDRRPLAYLVAGTVMGGVVLGAIVAALHEGLTRVGVPITGISLGIGTIGILAILSGSVARLLPQRSCQVPQHFLTPWPLRKIALRWGFSLVLGFCTYLVTPALFFLFAVVLDTKPLVDVVVVCSVYGFARGSSIAVAALIKDSRERAGMHFSEPPFRDLLRLPLAGVAAAALAFVIALG